MRFRWALLWVAAVVACEIIAFQITVHASSFVVFPKAAPLPSPDGRYLIRNTDREAPLSEYVGTFHFLFVDDTATGGSRKLCDYVGVAAVAWAKNDLIIVTQYVGKYTSRALVFVAADSGDPVVIDKSLLTSLVPVNLRSQLRENNHVFVEASKVEGEMLTLRVWGYGAHDAKGFSWRCEYHLVDGGVSCEERTVSK